MAISSAVTIGDTRGAMRTVSTVSSIFATVDAVLAEHREKARADRRLQEARETILGAVIAKACEVVPLIGVPVPEAEDVGVSLSITGVSDATAVYLLADGDLYTRSFVWGPDDQPFTLISRCTVAEAAERFDVLNLLEAIYGAVGCGTGRWVQATTSANDQAASLNAVATLMGLRAPTVRF